MRQIGPTIILVLLLTVFSINAFGQCEELHPDRANAKNWKRGYLDYFGSGVDTLSYIKADSVLIGYISNSKTTMDMACSYYKAEMFAQKELNAKIKVLMKMLKTSDRSMFQRSQEIWLNFYKSESEFLNETFTVYSNDNKYLLGTQENVKNPERKYNMIKQRILSINEYVETLRDN